MPAARIAGMPTTSNGAMSRSTSSLPSPAGAAGEGSLSVLPRRGEGTGSCDGSAPAVGGDGEGGASAGGDVGDSLGAERESGDRVSAGGTNPASADPAKR